MNMIATLTEFHGHDAESADQRKWRQAFLSAVPNCAGGGEGRRGCWGRSSVVLLRVLRSTQRPRCRRPVWGRCPDPSSLPAARPPAHRWSCSAPARSTGRPRPPRTGCTSPTWACKGAAGVKRRRHNQARFGAFKSIRAYQRNMVSRGCHALGWWPWHCDGVDSDDDNDDHDTSSSS